MMARVEFCGSRGAELSGDRGAERRQRTRCRHAHCTGAVAGRANDSAFVPLPSAYTNRKPLVQCGLYLMSVPSLANSIPGHVERQRDRPAYCSMTSGALLCVT